MQWPHLRKRHHQDQCEWLYLSQPGVASGICGRGGVRQGKWQGGGIEVHWLIHATAPAWLAKCVWFWLCLASFCSHLPFHMPQHAYPIVLESTYENIQCDIGHGLEVYSDEKMIPASCTCIVCTAHTRCTDGSGGHEVHMQEGGFLVEVRLNN